MNALFYKFFRNAARCFEGNNLFWHFLAIILTYICVASGFDWLYFTIFRNSAVYRFFFPAVILGALAPIGVPLVTLAVGVAKKSMRAINAAWAMGQAALLGLFISSFYKFFTGRVQPPKAFTQATLDISHDFRFGLFRGGVFWGWPSSHTTVAFAVAVAIILLTPGRKGIRFLALVYALYVGLGVSMSIHWFSEFLAGAIIGSVIGVVVAKSFGQRLLDAKVFTG